MAHNDDDDLWLHATIPRGFHVMKRQELHDQAELRNSLIQQYQSSSSEYKPETSCQQLCRGVNGLQCGELTDLKCEGVNNLLMSSFPSSKHNLHRIMSVDDWLSTYLGYLQ